MVTPSQSMPAQPPEHLRDERRVLGLFVRLVRVDHELETADPVGDGDRGVWTFGVGAENIHD